MKKIIALALSAVLLLALFAGCGGNSSTASSGSGELTVLKIGATPSPHAEILEQAKPLLKEKGIDLQITEFTDYVQPNVAVESGELDANYFQHQPYLDSFNEEQGTHLVSAGMIHYEPFGIYAGRTASLAALKNGAVIAVPNDTTNEARALQLLAAQGLITLKADAGLKATKNDIESNPKNLDIKEIEAAQISHSLQDVDLAVINGNYALDAGLSVAKDALATEDSQSIGATTYGNIIAVKQGNENSAAVKALVEVLKSDTIKNYINNTYNGAVVPIA